MIAEVAASSASRATSGVTLRPRAIRCRSSRALHVM
jgi:hypothetical protein